MAEQALERTLVERKKLYFSRRAENFVVGACSAILNLQEAVYRVVRYFTRTVPNFNFFLARQTDFSSVTLL